MKGVDGINGAGDRRAERAENDCKYVQGLEAIILKEEDGLGRPEVVSSEIRRPSIQSRGSSTSVEFVMWRILVGEGICELVGITHPILQRC